MSESRREESDAALWLEVTSGTSSSFDVIYDRYRRQVFRKAYMLTADVGDAEEVMAMVFLEAWRRRGEVRIVDGSLLPWLYATTGMISMNVERSKRRFKAAVQKLPAALPAPDIAIAVAETIDGLEQLSAIRDALQRLNPRERIVVQLCLIDELPLRQAAEVLDLPIGTVKSRLHRAREKLQRLLSGRRSPAGDGNLFGEVHHEPG